MLKNRIFYSNSTSLIFLISLTFAILIGEGIYGFGVDYYKIYNQHNLNFGSYANRLGWIISTFSYNQVHLGVHITTFILSISFGFLLRSTFNLKNINDIYFFILIFLIGLHTWPIIMSTSNGMRQGLCMSMIFLTFACYQEKKFFLSFVFLFFCIFMHKSGPLIVFVYVFSLAVNYFANKVNHSKDIFFVLFGIIIFIITLIIVDNFEDGSRQSRIIYKDYRYHFLIIGFIYLVFSFFKKDFLSKNIMHLYVYNYIFATISVLYVELNYEYERLQMMILIPMMFSVGLALTKRSFYIYCFAAFVLLLLLTINNGMYESFY